MSHPNCVRQLNFTFFCQTCSHNILRNITSSIRCRTIYFRTVFSRKSSAAMPCHTTIGIYNNLASCYTTISVRTTDDKTPCWIDEKFCILIYQFCWNNRFQYIFFYIFVDLLLCHIWIMLC